MDIAVVHYTQVGACNGWDTGGSVYNAGPYAAYVIFKVVSVDNTGSKVDFAFDPDRLHLRGASAHVDTSLHLPLGPFQAVPMTVPRGVLRGSNGYAGAVFSTSTSNGAVEANKTSYLLDYERASADPGVLSTKDNYQQTEWPFTENCTDIQLQ